MKIPRLLLFAFGLLATLTVSSFANETVNNGTHTGEFNIEDETLTVTSTGIVTSTDSRTVDVIGNVTVINSGIIRNTSTSTDRRGVQAHDSGINLTLTNNAGGLIETRNGDAVRMGDSNNTANIHNYGQIISLNTDNTGGDQAVDLSPITSGSNSLYNHAGGLIRANAADAVRMGRNGILTNEGTIETTLVSESGKASSSDGVDAQGNIGTQVINSGSISGRHGITGGNNDDGLINDFTMTVTNQTGGTITGTNGSGVNIDGAITVGNYSNVTVTNRGTIEGNYNTLYTVGDGDGVDIDGIANIDNYGLIRANGASGTANGEDNNAEGISIGGGTVINRENAEIIGRNTTGSDAAGNGILVDDSSGGNAFGAASITNSGTIEGESGFGIKIIGTFADTIVNESTGTIEGAGATSGAAVQTGGGADQVTNRGAIIGNNGQAVDLGAGADTLRIEGNNASITGSVNGGTENDTLIVDAGSGNTFATASTFSSFESVQLQSGTTVLQGANRVASGAALQMGDATLEFESIEAANGQSFTNLTITGDAIIDLGDTTSLTFNAFDDISAGSSLTVLGYDSSLSPTYALRFAGNWLSDLDFADLLNNLTINGGEILASYDGTYTNVTAVPEPSSAALVLLAGAALLARRRRK